MTSLAPYLLFAVVLVAFTVEAALGFGATVVAVALGSLFVPIDSILVAFVPLNMALSTILVVRNRAHIDGRLLATRILPCMLLGLPIGIWAFARLDASVLTAIFGAFVIALSAIELWRMRSVVESGRAPSRFAGMMLLVLAGAVHGAFATGGPLAVYVTGRELPDKARFRATLSTLWLVLNVVLVCSYAWGGRFDATSAKTSALWAIALVCGIFLGERVHARVSAAVFRRVVFGLLLVAGALLVLRALGS